MSAGYPLPREPGPLSPQAERTAVACVGDDGVCQVVGGVTGGAAAKLVAVVAPLLHLHPRSCEG